MIPLLSVYSVLCARFVVILTITKNNLDQRICIKFVSNLKHKDTYYLKLQKVFEKDGTNHSQVYEWFKHF